MKKKLTHVVMAQLLSHSILAPTPQHQQQRAGGGPAAGGMVMIKEDLQKFDITLEGTEGLAQHMAGSTHNDVSEAIHNGFLVDGAEEQEQLSEDGSSSGLETSMRRIARQQQERDVRWEREKPKDRTSTSGPYSTNLVRSEPLVSSERLVQQSPERPVSQPSCMNISAANQPGWKEHCTFQRGDGSVSPE
ncbi:hypothetical protein JOB18_019352 [Solea senegalensis]|uniref:Uncharacterized protein n=1 Tax=Solea senegalensis TaxID=28829 RepID=A0AAV6SHF4_SOLSE|nr:hypothetical protein JOB18_019352 [Solea senegalensis]